MHEITRLLERVRAGEGDAEDELYALVRDDLRCLAHGHMRRENAGHTLQTTVLVHDAYLRLVDEDVDWQGRTHFYRTAARVMRRLLVDHARGRQREKRGGDRQRVAMDGVLATYEDRALDVVAIHDALERLSGVNDELGKLVELRFFGGLSIRETADVLQVSTPTVERGWRTARAWLKLELGD